VPTKFAQAQEQKASRGEGYFKALTLKLDRGRYERLKAAGYKQGKTSQQILVEALDHYLRQAMS
jgi:predicted DNA-binding protein